MNIGRFLYCDNLVGLIFSLQITKFGFLWIFCVRQKSEKKIIKCNWLAALRIIWYFDRSVPGTSLLACLPGRCQHHTSVFVFVCILVFVKLFSYHQQVAAALATGCACVFSIQACYIFDLFVIFICVYISCSLSRNTLQWCACVFLYFWIFVMMFLVFCQHYIALHPVHCIALILDLNTMKPMIAERRYR